MGKIAPLITFVALAALTTAQVLNSASSNFINISRKRHNQTLLDMEAQVNLAQNDFAESLNTIDINSDMLADTIDQTNNRLNYLEVLGGSIRTCVSKYRKSMPTVYNARSQNSKCKNSAINTGYYIFNDAIATRNALKKYYADTFETQVKKCLSIYQYPDPCLTNAVTAAFNTTIASEKQFASQIASALCSITTAIQNALICNYENERIVLTFITNVNEQTEQCISDGDSICKNCKDTQCLECSQSVACTDIGKIKRTEISESDTRVSNPFYKNNKNCYMYLITN